MTEKTYDAAVVGASIAGCAAADAPGAGDERHPDRKPFRPKRLQGALPSMGFMWTRTICS